MILDEYPAPSKCRVCSCDVWDANKRLCWTHEESDRQYTQRIWDAAQAIDDLINFALASKDKQAATEFVEIKMRLLVARERRAMSARLEALP